MIIDKKLSRRQFNTGLVLAATASLLPHAAHAASDADNKQKYCAFIKFLRDYDYERLADQVAEAGFDGIEVTAREVEGYVHPAKAPDELPKLVETLAKRNLEIMILTTDILSAEQPHAQAMLRSAAELKIPRYRMGFFRYDLKKPIVDQLAKLQPAFNDIAAMNREIGIAGVYQNHCGPDFFSATVWDLREMLVNIPPSEIGCVFDIRHAEVEAGEAWPQLYNIMQPHITALSVKDYVWDGNKSMHAPLGEGRLNKKFFELVKASKFNGPISVHVEYLPKGTADENMQALQKDLKTLKDILSA
jgi:sugar phosphate isomerase/epimerase